MSDYTTQVRWIVEQVTQGQTNLTIKQKIEQSLPKIFDFDFPIWKEEYRQILEKKIIMHYFNKEIGFETVGLWKFYLDERLNLIMPYYNELYATTVVDYDYMTDTKFVETFDANKKRNEEADYSGNQTAKSTQADTSSAEGEDNRKDTHISTTLNSDFPQANAQGLDYGTLQSDVNETSTSNGTFQNSGKNNSNLDSTADTSSKNLVNTTDNENYTRNKYGTNGSRSFTELMMQYRDSLINIDNMIINELTDLFMLIY